MSSKKIAAAPSMRISDIVAGSIRDLVTIEQSPYGTIVGTPLSFPGGGSVVVQVQHLGANDYFVTDMGLAANEAELHGASSRMFRECARSVSEDSGVGFDHQSFFVARADESRLNGAIKAVANCALEAVQMVAFKLAEKQSVEGDIFIYERLVTIFGKHHVKQRTTFAGSSSHNWPVKARVDVDQGIALFETAAAHHNSIVNVYAKFDDISRLESPPRCVTIVRSRKSLGDYLGLLTQASEVLEVSVPDTEIQRLLAA